MNKIKNTFNNIFIETKFKRHHKTLEILDNIVENQEIRYIDDILSFMKDNDGAINPDVRSKTLFLGGMRGEILRKCPGSYGHICCNYSVINLYIGCPINCSYCILQSYLNQPATIINVDIENIFSNLRNIFSASKDRLFRIGTGELGDSLVYDDITNYSIDFVNFFTEFDNAIFEFKTKTDKIANLLKIIPNKGNMVVGFSVNPDIIINSEEKNAAALDDRINAMRLLIQKGYLIALHFDPLILIDNFEYEYETVIKKIFLQIESKKIQWISLGAFRYTTDLKKAIQSNYPDTKILAEEFALCEDKKFRYLRPVRAQLYKFILNTLKSARSDVPVYFCMESPQIWNELKPHNEQIKKIVFGDKI
ncbi:MAG TPA: radical SAM protein [Spirochaetota bacterium]|nr:radical SAM protein [Spirochaetota bacterium]